MSPSTYRAERKTIYLGDIPLEIAILPNGERCFSQTQVAGAIDKTGSSVVSFYTSKKFKSIPGDGLKSSFVPQKIYLEGANKPINPVPIKLAYFYWQKWAIAGNKKAQKLLWALLDNNVSELGDVSTTQLNTHGRIFCPNVRKMEQSTYKAERRTIYLGDFPLEVAMLPNGDYCLSQSQVAGARREADLFEIDKFQSSINYFLGSKYFKATWGKAFELTKLPQTLSVEGANKPINPISIKVACLYWHKWAAAGNKKAEQLVWASLDRNISDLADKAFNVKRTAEEQNQAFKQNLNSDPTACLEDFEQNPDNVLEFPSKETPNYKELQLKIRLAELELVEKIKSLEQPYNPQEIRKLGAFSPEVLVEIKDRLKLKSWEQTERFLEKIGFGKDSEKWVEIKVSGAMPVLPWQSVKELRQICSATKLRRNQQSTEQ